MSSIICVENNENLKKLLFGQKISNRKVYLRFESNRKN